jgi:NADPH-dependent glutamate synthase beta subunit-like oxidoreductase
VGLGRLSRLLENVLDGRAKKETVCLIRETASVIADSADCTIGYDAARLVLDNIRAFEDDFLEHIEKGRCLFATAAPVPCVAFCPANVDIPGYLALINAGRCADAVRLIRKDNPFPVSCGYICEHPCEGRCRRAFIDDAVNIRGLKRFAVDNTGDVPPHAKAAPTGKKVAVLGGGPSGLTAAYYLSLMGHEVTVYERRRKLGGMLRYGIPAYRFPRELLDRDINTILQTGVQVKLETDVGTNISIDEIKKAYDAIYIAIGANTDSKARVDGENLKGVISAVQMLRGIGDGEHPDFSGKTVAIIGGGNVAMDVTRTSLRLGAKKVYCVYRRRQVDMTALPEEVEGAIAEGAELVTLKAPVRIEGDANDNVVALRVQPQIPGELDSGGRPRPVNAALPEERIACDIIIVAVGQKIETAAFEKAGIPVKDGAIKAMENRQIISGEKIFSGGDCVSGPASAIKAIADGKVAAANIDEFLGFSHGISVDVAIPNAAFINRPPRGRVNTAEREAVGRVKDFDCIECGMTQEGAAIESSRCLRCDHYGYGVFKGGRNFKW